MWLQLYYDYWCGKVLILLNEITMLYVPLLVIALQGSVDNMCKTGNELPRLLSTICHKCQADGNGWLK